MKIRWINHASFVVEGDDFKLLVDPWLIGAAFNNGWDLMAPTITEDSYWAQITHIWFSHEHPDHFSPPSINSIKDKLSPGVVVVYQETVDKRVVGYCRAKGYQVIEVKDRQKIRIGHETEIMIGQVPFYDSWLFLESKGQTLLNLNDCVIKGRRQVADIKKACGSVDILLSQFGYANWEGNPGDDDRQKASASEKLRRLQLVESEIRPRYIFPFASFVIFSHDENFYLNANNNTVKMAVDFIKKHCMSEPIVLKPNDSWEPGQEIPLAENVEFYEQKRLGWSSGKTTTKSFSDVELVEIIEKYKEKVLQKNNRLLVRAAAGLGFFKTITFYVRDLDIAINFDYTKKAEARQRQYDDETDVKLSSDSLAFLFQNEYGFDTLSVNGRFRSSRKVENHMFRVLSVGALNNMGLSFSFTLPFRWRIISRALAKLAA